MPRWADFDDPLDAISARARGIKSRTQREAEMAMEGRFSREEASALEVMGLGSDTDAGSCGGATLSWCDATTPIAMAGTAAMRRG